MYPEIDVQTHHDKLTALAAVIRNLVPEIGEKVAEAYASAWYMNMHADSGYIRAYWAVHGRYSAEHPGEVYILQKLDRVTEEQIRAAALLLFT